MYGNGNRWNWCKEEICRECGTRSTSIVRVSIGTAHYVVCQKCYAKIIRRKGERDDQR